MFINFLSVSSYFSWPMLVIIVKFFSNFFAFQWATFQNFTSTIGKGLDVFSNIMLTREDNDNFMTLAFPLSFCICFSFCIKQLFQEIESYIS